MRSDPGKGSRQDSKALRRCAIYTRVSTDSGLDQDFNSLDNQREASEAYIKSQAHEGWNLVRDCFDDRGFSGGSMERPALQKLLGEIRARRIDIVVIYKVDRLTRSLADFAKLVEHFDAHEVSFISVTQAFNTTSSMGRLTLNMLLSFAQFEREITGERIRDKVAASKRKGIWMGGAVPLGYRVENRALHVVEEEADFVRDLFRRYLDLGSVVRLKAALDDGGAERRCASARAGARPEDVRSPAAISIGYYRTRSMSGGSATRARSTKDCTRGSSISKHGKVFRIGFKPKLSPGESRDRICIPFSSASFSTIAATGWGRLTPAKVRSVFATTSRAQR
jgi:DNA invertase Pin-like site-specific DNA recombinase